MFASLQSILTWCQWRAWRRVARYRAARRFDGAEKPRGGGRGVAPEDCRLMEYVEVKRKHGQQIPKIEITSRDAF
jgi:hypothetical protein